MLNKKQYKKHYLKALNDIYEHIDVDKISKTFLAKNDYDFYNFNMKQYLRNSWVRSYNVYKSLPDKNIAIADVGGFFGNFSLSFARLGYKMTMFESYEYYDDCFDPLIEYLKNNGVQIENVNFVKNMSTDIWNERFDCTLCLAFLEHIAGSPKSIIENLKRITKRNGFIFLEVPNIASILNRLQLLVGQTILPNIASIYKSDSPFMGHFHEYTITELKKLIQLSQLTMFNIATYNYSQYTSLAKYFILLPSYLIKSMRELILVKINNK